MILLLCGLRTSTRARKFLRDNQGKVKLVALDSPLRLSYDVVDDTYVAVVNKEAAPEFRIELPEVVMSGKWDSVLIDDEGLAPEVKESLAQIGAFFPDTTIGPM